MKWVCLFVTGAFCVLASYAYGVVQPLPMQHYVKAKPVILHRTDKARMIADIWGIRPEEKMADAVNIFGK